MSTEPPNGRPADHIASPPRLCTLLESYAPVVGGMETQARNLATILAEKGVQQIVVTRRTNPSLPRHEVLDGIPIFRTGPTGRSSRYRWAFMVTCIGLLIRLRKQYDVILVPGFRALGVAAVVVRALLGKPCVLKAECIGEMSGAFFTGGLDRMKLKRKHWAVQCGLALRNSILRRADVFISMYGDMTQEYTSYGVDPAKITLIPQSVNETKFHPPSDEERSELRRRLGLPETGRCVLYAGRLVSYKGVPLLLDVWRTITEEHPDAKLILAGGGGVDQFNCEDDLRDASRRHGLEDSVVFLGDITNVDEYMQACDIFALPTENDAFPLCILEAMAAGMAIITTGVGALKDVITHEQTGLVMEPGNREQLLDAVRRLLTQPALLEQLGRSARDEAVSRYTRDIVAEQYLDVVNPYAHP